MLRAENTILQDAVAKCIAAQDAGTATLGARVATASTAHARKLVHLKWRVDVTMTTVRTLLWLLPWLG